MKDRIWQDIKRALRPGGNPVAQLIIINLIVFIVINVAENIIKLTLTGSAGNVLYDTRYADALYSLFKTVCLIPEPNILITHFWTPLTYMFVHEGFWHILFNMMWLFWFGKMLQEHLGRRSVTISYLLGGLAGGLCFIMIYNMAEWLNPDIFDLRAPLLGASAGVMGVVFTMATVAPHRRLHLLLIGPVKVIHIAVAALIFTSLIDLADNTGGKVAHLGGAAMGYLYARGLQSGRNPGQWLESVLDYVRNIFKPKPKTHRTTRQKTPPRDDIDWNAQKVNEQKRMDAILDKISKSGYDSLTKEEKTFLFKASNR